MMHGVHIGMPGETMKRNAHAYMHDMVYVSARAVLLDAPHIICVLRVLLYIHTRMVMRECKAQERAVSFWNWSR